MILVTGGAGYIGSVLVQKLVDRGYKVRIFDRFYFGKKHLAHLGKSIDLVVGDVRRFDPKYLSGVDAIIHLAALSNDPTAELNPKANWEINFLATKKLAADAKWAGIRKFVFASSCSVYYTSIDKVKRAFDEDDKINPRAPYSLSKKMAEGILMALADKEFMPTILRAGTVYGFSPRMRYDLVVNTMVKDAIARQTIMVLARGEQWRPLVDINDLAKTYLAVLEAPEYKVAGQIFNVVFDNFKVKEIAGLVQKALNGKIGIKIDRVQNNLVDRSYKVSGQKLEKVMGIRPKISIEDSVKSMTRNIKKFHYNNFEHPKYYNISWMMTLAEMDREVFDNGPIF
ncbi:MAG: SDR family oxidoreductase [Patescibacteria group bacterium]